MRVIHILSGLYQGGAESQLENLVNYSTEKEYDVEHIIISLKNDETPLMRRFHDTGVTVYCLGFSGVASIMGFFRLVKLLKELVSPNTVIQCWMYHANVFGLLASFFAGTSSRVIFNIRRTELPKGITGLLAKVAARLSSFSKTAVVCCAEAAKRSHEAVGYNRNRMIVIHNGIDVDLFVPDRFARKQFRHEIGLTDGDFVVGMVGRYAPIKGHLFLLKAFKKLVIENRTQNFPLKLVLVGRDIEQAESIKPFFTDPLLAKHLIVVPERARISNVMPAFDLLCLPSKSEGFPNVVAEAMSCGVPALVTDVGDASVIVGDSEMVVPPQSDEDLCMKLADYIHYPESKKSELAKAARERIQHCFSMDAAWEKYDELYKKTIGCN